MAKGNTGCAYGQVNRQIVTDLKQDISDIKINISNLDSNINSEMGKLRGQLNDAYNHFSTRLPGWGTLIITILSSIVTGLSIWALTHGH